MRRVLEIAVLASLAIARAASAAGPPVDADGLYTEPVLRIEPGTHTDIVSAIASDAEARWVVTGSQDGTVRVWDRRSGALAQVLRVPLGHGRVSRVYAADISRDGRWIVAAGWLRSNDECLLIFDRTSARLSHSTCGMPSTVHVVAFSPDGARIAATLGSGNGMRLFDRATGKQIASDTEYGDDGRGLAFLPDGRFATSSPDGKIRLYDERGNLVRSRDVPQSVDLPHRIAASADGRYLALGYTGSTRVVVFTVSDLALLAWPTVPENVTGSLGRVAWSREHRMLFAAGRAYSLDEALVSWRNKQWTAPARLSIANNTVQALAALEGDVIAFASSTGWGTVSGTNVEGKHEGAVLDFRGVVLAVSQGGAKVYASTGGRALRFSVDRRVLERRTGEKGLGRPRTTSPQLSVSSWEDQLEPSVAGSKLKSLDANETSRSLSIRPGDQRFVLGTDWYLRSFDRSGAQKWSVETPTAWGANHSGDGRIVVAALGDGTIRWYRESDGTALLALYVHPDLERWIAWTPRGYYDAAPGAEGLLGWHVNRGKDQAADFFPASRFRDRYYRPDIISRVLTDLDEDKAIAAANASRQAPPPTVPWDRMQPPVVKILSPESDTPIGKPQLELSVSIRSPSGEPVQEIIILVDGRPAGTRDSALAAAKKTAADGGDLRTIVVPIPPKPCTVSVLARTKYSTSEPDAIHLRWIGGPPPGSAPVIQKPNAYVLAVGVTKYSEPTLNTLHFPHSDAESFAKAWKRQEGRLYAKVETRVLTNEKATKDAILDGLEWLQRSTKQHDVAVLLLGGHGQNDYATSEYHFLPHNADANAVKRTYLPKAELVTTTRSVAGKILVFLDSCHAGAALGPVAARDARDLTALINELISAENGAVVYTAATGRQLSQESSKWGGGAFSVAAVACLDGAAQENADGGITTIRLATCIGERVHAMTNGTQKTIFDPGHVPEFPIATSGSGPHPK